MDELIEIRKDKGINQHQMARLIGIKQSGVQHIETNKNPTLKTLAKYIEVLGLDLNDIFAE